MMESAESWIVVQRLARPGTRLVGIWLDLSTWSRRSPVRLRAGDHPRHPILTLSDVTEIAPKGWDTHPNVVAVPHCLVFAAEDHRDEGGRRTNFTQDR